MSEPSSRGSTVKDWRRARLRELIDTHYGGVQSRFGSAVDRQSDYVSRLVTGKKDLGERVNRRAGLTSISCSSLNSINGVRRRAAFKVVAGSHNRGLLTRLGRCSPVLAAAHHARIAPQHAYLARPTHCNGDIIGLPGNGAHRSLLCASQRVRIQP
jgi:hypothetical protein